MCDEIIEIIDLNSLEIKVCSDACAAPKKTEALKNEENVKSSFSLFMIEENKSYQILFTKSKNFVLS